MDALTGAPTHAELPSLTLLMWVRQKNLLPAGSSSSAQSSWVWDKTEAAHIMSEAEFPLSRRGFVIVAGVAATGAALTSTPSYSQTWTPAMQATIRTDDRLITLVSVFTVEPTKLPSLIDVLRNGTETFFSKMPGFVSSSVLTAKDGRQAINYSQWRSAEEIAAYRRDPRFEPYIRQLVALAKAETTECDVAYVRSV
jgi:heme-degrading monooxygenase HmoA